MRLLIVTKVIMRVPRPFCEGYTDARIRTDRLYIRSEAIGSTLVFISCGCMNLNLDNTPTDSTQHTDESFDHVTFDTIIDEGYTKTSGARFI